MLLSVAKIPGDKIPGGPNRTVPLQLSARVSSGAFVGAVIFKANKQSVIEGMVLNGASALSATFAGFYLRMGIDKSLMQKTGL